MTAQRSAFDKMTQTLQRKFTLNDDRRIGFLNKIHITVRFRTVNTGAGEIAFA